MPLELKVKYCLSLICVCFASIGFSQILIDSGASPESVVSQTLLGPGVEAENIMFNGQAGTVNNVQLGTFSNAANILGIDRGIVLATGKVSVCEGPNDLPTAHEVIPEEDQLLEEPDLQVLLPNADLKDVAVLNFDFRAQGDTLRFTYVFASEEYNEHTCSPYNDVFGFFISGPGISPNPDFENDATNLAFIPGTSTPVAINTINLGIPGTYGSSSICNNIDPNWASYSDYFVDNSANTSLNTTQFDGFTVPMEVVIPVICGETYHIKLAIADAIDDKNDSAVFIEAESFQSEAPLEIEYEITGHQVDENMVEGCSEVEFTLLRSDSSSQKVVYLELSESINSTIFPGFPDSLIFYPQQGKIAFTIQSENNEVFEGQRSFEISFLQPATCGQDTAIHSIHLSLIDKPPLTVTYSDSILIPCDEPANIHVEVEGGYPPYSIDWDREELVGFSAAFSGEEEAAVQAVITDECLLNEEIITINLIPEQYDSLTIITPESISFNCLNPVILEATVLGGAGPIQYEWEVNDVVIGEETTLITTLSQSAELQFTAFDRCASTASKSIYAEMMENPINVVLPPDTTGYCDQELTIFPQVSGGFGNLSFRWYNNQALVSVSSNYSLTPLSDRLIVLKVEDDCGQMNSDTVFVSVPDFPITIDLPSDTAICLGDRLDLFPDVDGGYGEFEFLWLERNASSQSISIIPDQDLELNFRVEDECNTRSEAAIRIDVQEVTAQFVFDYENEAYPIQNHSTPGCSYLWTFSDGSTSNQFEPLYNGNAGESDPVFLNVTNSIGCYDDVVKFFDPPLNIFIPNAFTPDGDGLNDVFKVEGTFISEFELFIFDRWGDLVFHSTDPETGWDGSGSEIEFANQDAVFSYRCIARAHTGAVFEKSGSITVLR